MIDPTCVSTKPHEYKDLTCATACMYEDNTPTNVHKLSHVFWEWWRSALNSAHYSEFTALFLLPFTPHSVLLSVSFITAHFSDTHGLNVVCVIEGRKEKVSVREKESKWDREMLSLL